MTILATIGILVVGIFFSDFWERFHMLVSVITIFFNPHVMPCSHRRNSKLTQHFFTQTLSKVSSEVSLILVTLIHEVYMKKLLPVLLETLMRIGRKESYCEAFCVTIIFTLLYKYMIFFLFGLTLICFFCLKLCKTIL